MCCVRVVGVCVPGGSRSLLKLSQVGRCWDVGKYWERCWRRGGVGGSSFPRISAGQRWQHLTIYIENFIISGTMITKKLFVIRRAKMPLQGVLPLPPIKSRRTPENAVQRIYIKFGNTKTAKMCAVQGRRETAYLYIRMRAFC